MRLINRLRTVCKQPPFLGKQWKTHNSTFRKLVGFKKFPLRIDDGTENVGFAVSLVPWDRAERPMTDPPLTSWTVDRRMFWLSWFFCENADLLEPPKPRKIGSSSKVTKKWLSSYFSFFGVSGVLGGQLHNPFSLYIKFVTLCQSSARFVRKLFVTCDVFVRYFFVVFPWLFRCHHLLGKKTVFGHFSCFFRVFSWFFLWTNITRTRPGKIFFIWAFRHRWKQSEAGDLATRRAGSTNIERGVGLPSWDHQIGNGRNTASRVLFRRKELTDRALFKG